MAARSIRAEPADRNHPLQLDTPARRSGFQLSAGSNLTLAALGVVFGDIGTSPLYAVRQSLIDFADLSERAILATAREINADGVAILLVEQNANYALDAAARGYVFETGRIALANDSASLRDDPEVQKAYLGT